MRPLDPRLLRTSRAARSHLILNVGIGVTIAVLVVAQAMLLSTVITDAFLSGATLASLRGALLALLVLAAGRGLLVWAAEVTGHRSAARVISELRMRLLGHLVAAGPVVLSEERSGELATTATQGLDALDGYFARFLPQLVLALVVPPLAIAWVLHLDILAAVTLAVTVPLIPVFMVLIGLAAEQRTRARWEALSQLSAHFLDVLQGLPTLRIFGRARIQAERIREVTEVYRRTTMGTLRIAFLSALVLEMLATMGTALVAVGVGLRLVDGGLDLRSGLAVLILAPEVYLPLRQVGSMFHASVDGIAAAQRAFALLDTRITGAGGHATAIPDPARSGIRLSGVRYTYPSRTAPALDGLDLELRPGERLALVGPSGAGKSTVVALLMRFAAPSAGTVAVGGVDLESVPVDVWRRLVAWVPQRAHLFRGSVADNIRLGVPDADADSVRRAARAAGADGFVERLPRGYDTPVGENGLTLSAGERQRIALARALLRETPLLILDEPDANLDARSRAALHATLAEATRGRTALVVGHGHGAASWVDRVAVLEGGRIVADGPPHPLAAPAPRQPAGSDAA